MLLGDALDVEAEHLLERHVDGLAGPEHALLEISLLFGLKDRFDHRLLVPEVLVQGADADPATSAM